MSVLSHTKNGDFNPYSPKL